MTWIATGTPDRRRWVNLDHVASSSRTAANGDLELIAPDGRSLGVTAQPIAELPAHKHPRKPPRPTVTPADETQTLETQP